MDVNLHLVQKIKKEVSATPLVNFNLNGSGNFSEEPTVHYEIKEGEGDFITQQNG